jgi:periplasmic protein TonB
MKSIPVLSSDWMNVVDLERNQIVFHNRNQAFGAFKIRMEYNQTLFYSLLIASAIFIAIPSSFVFLSQQETEIIPAHKIMEDEIFIVNILPVEPLKPAEQIKTPEPPVSTKENIVPVVVTETLPVKTPEPAKNIVEPTTNPASGPGGGTNEKPGNETGTTATVPFVEPIPDNTVYKAVETMPLFPGGETEMFRFLMKNTLYPQDDKLVGNQGTVFVYFVIDKNGFPTNIKIMNPKRGKENLEKEAMRVIGKMPQWIPGKQNGKPALVSFTLPIRFVSN